MNIIIDLIQGGATTSAPNVEVEKDRELFGKLGMKIEGDSDQIDRLNDAKTAKIEKKQNIYNLKLIN